MCIINYWDCRVGINIVDWCILVKKFDVVKFCVKMVFGVVIVFKLFLWFFILEIIWIMEKLYERKINDLYKLFNGKCFEEI